MNFNAMLGGSTENDGLASVCIIALSKTESNDVERKAFVALIGSPAALRQLQR